MLENNTLFEFGGAYKRWIVELKKSLNEERAIVTQLKADYDNLKAQSQSQIQGLSNSLDQLNLEISTTRASMVEEYKTFSEITNLIDEKFLEGATKVKAIIKIHHPS